jgi:hypothetical protein
MPPTIMRLLLIVCLLGLLLLAALYLRRKRLSRNAYLSWGLFALLVPLVGPFLAIFSRPGNKSRGNPKAGAHVKISICRPDGSSRRHPSG